MNWSKKSGIRLFFTLILLFTIIQPKITQVNASAGMEQVIFGGYYGLLHTTYTRYNSLFGGSTWGGTSYYEGQLISTDGVIKNLRFKLNDAPGVGKKYTFTLMLNANPTAITFDIAGLETSGSNMIDEIIVKGGDYVSLRCIPDNTPIARYATWTSMFEGDLSKESLILGHGTNLDKVDIMYGNLMGAYTVWNPDENRFRQVVPTDGTIKNFYLRFWPDAGTAPDAYRFTLRKNGANTSLTVTITADDVIGNDLINTVDVVTGDVLTLMVEPLNSPSGSPYPLWGMTFLADVDGESIVMGGSMGDLDDAVTEYHYLTTWEGDPWWADETHRFQLGQNCTMKKLNILLSGPPGAGNKYDFTLRIASADSSLVATVSDTNITGNSGSAIDYVSNDEYLSLQVVPTDAPDSVDAYWGLVGYIAPPTPPMPPIIEIDYFPILLAIILCLGLSTYFLYIKNN